MRSYNQYCSMARALDLVGDRWTLLIVRELLTQGPCRFADLRRGLPGIASNLLADRLREMEATGLLVRTEEPPPVAATLIRLTARGRDLGGVVGELTRWGAPLMAAPPEDDEFRVHWFALPLRHFARDGAPDEPPVTVRLGDLSDGCDVLAGGGRVDVRPCSTDRQPDATVTAPPQVLIRLFTGQISVRKAQAEGLTVSGSVDALERVLPERGERRARPR
ncbi:transcriptional regulator [Nocardia puris]|uniref:winged helix-turn-helix transcriptional regulator n=1 Tax=Nocardia puris TaxID=208602 RepID=UPI001894EDF5|nr:winged helix-turn-helix transcriptional regulator [Nocardia puris]MBF6212370.1 transcriptional regulator [Nocardia puris]MBF6366617.1 transcriptional regulator [Nocardia puris]MBF6460959.1 transcriptional regulator [Nocardia puris]